MFCYMDYDDIDFIKSLNIDECRSLISKLDFSNYVVVINDGEIQGDFVIIELIVYIKWKFRYC